MNFLCAVIVKKIHGFFKLCASYNGIVHKKQLFVPYKLGHGNLLHFCNTVSVHLLCGCKASLPGRSVFNKGTGKRRGVFVCIAYSVGNTGIRHTAYVVQILRHTALFVIFSHYLAVAVTHKLNVHSLVAGGGVSVVRPKECAYLHFLARLGKSCHTVLGNFNYFAGSQLAYRFISQLLVCKGFKGRTVAAFVFANDHGSSAQLITGGDYSAVILEYKQGKTAFDLVLNKLNALYKVFFSAYKRRRKVGRVYDTACHSVKMSVCFNKVFVYQLIGVINGANGAYCKFSQSGAYKKGLGVAVAYTADSGISLHFLKYMLKLCSEGGVFYIMNLSL